MIKPKTLFQGSQFFKATSIVNGKTVEDTELRENIDNNQQVIEGHIGSKPVHIRRKLGNSGNSRYSRSKNDAFPYSKKKNRYIGRRSRFPYRSHSQAYRSHSQPFRSQAYRKLKSRSRKLKPLRFDI